MIGKFLKSEKSIYIALFILAFIVAFSSTYNPLVFRRMHVDSAAYITITQGITRGELPYRDFADNKSPLLYLISAPGFYLAKFTGVWITEIIFLFVSVIFAFKTALFFADKHKAFLGTVFTFVAFLAFFTVHGGTEEYSMPFWMISLYIFTRYYFTQRDSASFRELIILGFCFACTIMIKLNLFPLWAGFCLAIFIETAIKRRFGLLAKYIFGFSLGAIFVLLPIYFYLRINGIFDYFLEQVIFAGGAKGFAGFDASVLDRIKNMVNYLYLILNRTFSFLPLIFGFIWMATNFRKPIFFYYFAYTLSYILMLLFLSFSGGTYGYYNMALIPFFIPAVTYSVNIVDSVFSGIKRKNIALVLLFCIMFSEGIMKWTYDFSKIIHNDSGIKLINAGIMIDENTRPGDTIISLGSAYIYPFTQRRAASRYFFQGTGTDLIPGAVEEFVSDILTKRPAIIASFTDEIESGVYLEGWHTPVRKLMESDYRLLSRENGFDLYILKDR